MVAIGPRRLFHRSAAGDIPWLAKVWTGILLGGAQARAGLLTAALLEQLVVPGEVVRGFDPPESPITIYVGGRVEPRYGYRFQREEPGLRLPSPAREPARTRIEDTVLDLCAAGDEESTVMWVTRACQRRLTTPRRLADRLTERPRLTGRGLIREMVMDARAGATSNLEHRALHQVFRAHGLPPAQWQHRTGPHQRVADVAFAQYGVLIELDGRVGHVEEGAFRDMRRDNHHTLDGWVTLRFGWADIAANPCAVAAQIARLLRARGWRGDLTPCPFCH